MSEQHQKTMRDAFLGRLYAAMQEDDAIFILSDDFGAPVLDRIRTDFGDRFVNVGIAEQNAVNVATGLALEGFTTYVYGIAAFVSMRCYEQIRTNLSMASQVRPVNVNIVGVGAGLSYDLSGPSHHCLEDLALMRLLPSIEVLSPSDWKLAERFADYCVEKPGPKYLRLDSKPVDRIYDGRDRPVIEDGFCELARGAGASVVSTGFMTQVALRALERVNADTGLVDVFALSHLNEKGLFEALRGYERLVTVEEGFLHRGGLDTLILNLLRQHGSSARLVNLGVEDRYVFELGGRSHLHAICGMDEQAIIAAVQGVVSQDREPGEASASGVGTDPSGHRSRAASG